MPEPPRSGSNEGVNNGPHLMQRSLLSVMMQPRGQMTSSQPQMPLFTRRSMVRSPLPLSTMGETNLPTPP